MKGLDFSKLSNALDSMEITLDLLSKNEKKELVNVFNSALIKNFEFCFELCWKYLFKWLKINRSVEPSVSKKEIFRLASEYGLINSYEDWINYLVTRNSTTHTYDNELVETSLEDMKKFITDAQNLYEKISK